MNAVRIAPGLTTFAGMATGIGSAVAFTAKRGLIDRAKKITEATGGTVAFIELIADSLVLVAPVYAVKPAPIAAPF